MRRVVIEHGTFAGDGRYTLRYPGGQDFGRPVPHVTLHTARKFIRDFQARRYYRSFTGGLLWVHKLWCDETKTPYEIFGGLETGWCITLT